MKITACSLAAIMKDIYILGLMYVSELGLNLEKRPIDRIIIYVRSGKCMVQSARESHKGAVQ